MPSRRPPQAGARAVAGASAARAGGDPRPDRAPPLVFQSLRDQNLDQLRPCCQGKLAKLGGDVTETLEAIPRQWTVVQTVRERFTCRACETITQPPAPFHPIARGRVGPELLAMILEAKFGQQLPLNRPSETYAREVIEIDVSTMADWVGACTATLAPPRAGP